MRTALHGTDQIRLDIHEVAGPGGDRYVERGEHVIAVAPSFEGMAFKRHVCPDGGRA